MKKNYNEYLIALDLDGTLLNDKKEISFLTKKYLKKLNKKGVNIILCSGRPPRTIKKYYQELNLNTPVVGYNGALIYNPNLNTTYIEHKFDKNLIFKIYENLKPYIDSFLAEDESNIYYDQEDDFLLSFFKKDGLNEKIGSIKDIICQDTYTFIMKLNKKGDENKDEVIKIVENTTSQYRIRFWWDSDYCELHIKDIDKATSLTKLVNDMKINHENVIVFGDADNDIELLKSFKHSFLMKNGHIYINEIVPVKITYKDNNHNGIRFELKKYFSSFKTKK